MEHNIIIRYGKKIISLMFLITLISEYFVFLKIYTDKSVSIDILLKLIDKSFYILLGLLFLELFYYCFIKIIKKRKEKISSFWIVLVVFTILVYFQIFLYNQSVDIVLFLLLSFFIIAVFWSLRELCNNTLIRIVILSLLFIISVIHKIISG